MASCGRKVESITAIFRFGCDVGIESFHQEPNDGIMACCGCEMLFYGATDPTERATKFVELSIRFGSYAAVKVAQNLSAKDEMYERTALHWAVWRGCTATLDLVRG